MSDASFAVDRDLLLRGVDALSDLQFGGRPSLPRKLPEEGVGELTALNELAPKVLGEAARLDSQTAFAHMDPPTATITWAMTLWNARLNQNLLHPVTAPFAREAEELVVSWLAPLFGMDGGHMVPGSTVANLSAIWAAREIAGVRRVIASSAAHLSVRKAAHILGLPFEAVDVDACERLDPDRLGRDLSHACLVLTAGTTSSGAMDPLDLCGRAAWTHVDAAWAGPLRLSDRHKHLLAGIEAADSVAVSAHKWLFQPKESALLLFRDTEKAHCALSFGGSYLAVPNIGLLGSHGAVAIPLLATLLALGRSGIAERLDRCMAMTESLAAWVKSRPDLELFREPSAGILLFRPVRFDAAAFVSSLPHLMASLTQVEAVQWVRCVAANPNAAVTGIIDSMSTALSER